MLNMWLQILNIFRKKKVHIHCNRCNTYYLIDYFVIGAIIVKYYDIKNEKVDTQLLRNGNNLDRYLKWYKEYICFKCYEKI